MCCALKKFFHIIWLNLCSVNCLVCYLYSMTFYILAVTDKFSSEDNITISQHTGACAALSSFFLLLRVQVTSTKILGHYLHATLEKTKAQKGCGPVTDDAYYLLQCNEQSQLLLESGFMATTSTVMTQSFWKIRSVSTFY